MRGFNYKKTVQALNILARKSGGEINKMKAVKLVWLADRWHLRQYGRTITGDIYFAMPFGPVPSTTLNLISCEENYLSDDEQVYSREFIQSIGSNNYRSAKEPYTKVFSDTDMDALNRIWDAYHHLDRFQLSDLSHSFAEWKKFESALKKKISSRFDIDIEDFFEDADDGFGLFLDDKENTNYSKEIFRENNIFLKAMQ